MQHKNEIEKKKLWYDNKVKKNKIYDCKFSLMYDAKKAKVSNGIWFGPRHAMAHGLPSYGGIPPSFYNQFCLYIYIHTNHSISRIYEKRLSLKTILLLLGMGCTI